MTLPVRFLPDVKNSCRTPNAITAATAASIFRSESLVTFRILIDSQGVGCLYALVTGVFNTGFPSWNRSLSNTAARNRSQSNSNSSRTLEDTPRISNAIGCLGAALYFSLRPYLAAQASTYDSHIRTSARNPTTVYFENTQWTVASTSSLGISPP